MKKLKVKDLMVPLDEYATVSEDANLYEAIQALEEAQKRFKKDHYKHRAVLVFGKKGNIVGKLSQLDVIVGLESGYKNVGELKGVTRSGFTSELIRSMIEKYRLWDKPLDDICRKATRIKVKNIMYTPTVGEYVEEEASLDQAIHQLMIGRHQSLLVTGNEKIVGVLRLTDIFTHICDRIKACQLG